VLRQLHGRRIDEADEGPRQPHRTADSDLQLDDWLGNRYGTGDAQDTLTAVGGTFERHAQALTRQLFIAGTAFGRYTFRIDELVGILTQHDREVERLSKRRAGGGAAEAQCEGGIRCDAERGSNDP
jgi:hypothetical protein